MIRFVGRLVSVGVVALGPALLATVGPTMSAGATGPPTSSATCDTYCQDITTEGQELVAVDGGPPGVFVLVDRNGVDSVYSFGTSEVGAHTPITSSDHLRLASVSKMYSGAVALALVADGTLRLSEPVGRLVPHLPRAWRGVTLAQLLHHESGIPDFIRAPEFARDITANPYDPPSRFGLVRLAFGLPFRPGHHYDYSNTDNELVALMVQAATKRSYEHELAVRVTDPLGLDDTTLPQIEDLPGPYASGYAVGAGRSPEDVTNAFSAGWSWASGGVVSTPVDVDRFVRAYAQGVLTVPAVHADQFDFVPGSSEPPGPGTNSAGLGIFRYATACGTIYGHTGNTLGYTQFAAATEDGTRSVVVQVNGQVTPAEPTATAFADLLRVETSAVCAALEP
jgi:D-alanyl-D-alanine carboxypeptidase